MKGGKEEMGREGMQVVCCGGDRFVWWCREASSIRLDRKIGKHLWCSRRRRQVHPTLRARLAPAMDVRTEAVWKVEARLLDDRLNGTTNLLPTWPEDEGEAWNQTGSRHHQPERRSENRRTALHSS